jgi:hypothetical protein
VTDTAQVLEIRRRPKSDPLALASLDLFTVLPGHQVPLAALDDPGISLYCLDPRRHQAIFADTGAEARLEDDVFVYLGQRTRARRFLAVSYETLHGLAQARGDWFDGLGVIYSVGRCGSTVLSAALGGLRRVRSLSEPDVFTQVAGLELGEASRAELLRSCVRMLVPPSANTHLVIKMRSMAFKDAGPMSAAFPQAGMVFMYRNLADVIVSSMQAFRIPLTPLWWIDVLHRGHARPILSAILKRAQPEIERFLPAVARYTPRELAGMGLVGAFTLGWLGAMDHHHALADLGQTIPALRYEDLVASPASILSQTFRALAVPHGPEDLVLPRRDAQAGSPLARSARKAWSFTARDRTTMERLLADHPRIRHGDHRLAATLDPGAPAGADA